MNHRRIDVHHHILPPSSVAWLRGVGVHEAGGRNRPTWSPEAALHVLDEHGIATAIVSVSTPGVRPAADTSGDEARRRARRVNGCAAGVGLFAGMLDAFPEFDDAGRAAIDRGSAERLFAAPPGAGPS